MGLHYGGTDAPRIIPQRMYLSPSRRLDMHLTVITLSSEPSLNMSLNLVSVLDPLKVSYWEKVSNNFNRVCISGVDT